MSRELIPVFDLKREMEDVHNQIFQAIEGVMGRGSFILGQEVEAFEKEFARYLGARFCIGVASGTDAISLALQACGVSAGDEVITVSHSAVATVAAIECIGAIPVLVDIDPHTRCIDPEKIKSALTKKTKAIVPVHIYGQPAPMKRITELAKEYGIYVVEDCAQAHGAEIQGKKVGTFGHAAAFSFYPTKNLGAFGDGGAVVSSSSRIDQKVRWLREYGWKKRYISSFPGINSRLDELQAAILRVKLKILPQNLARRQEIAAMYCQAVAGHTIRLPEQLEGTRHAMHLFVVESHKRNALQQFLNSEGIGTAIHYPKAIHQQPAYSRRIRGREDLHYTEMLYKKILTLPLYPGLRDQEVKRICNALTRWCREQG